MLSDEIKNLEEELKETKEKLNDKEYLLSWYKNRFGDSLKIINSMMPVKIYTHKKRGNTTVKFADNSSVTVKRRKGEKDCIETAIAYCLLKQCIPTKILKYLINNKEEH